LISLPFIALFSNDTLNDDFTAVKQLKAISKELFNRISNYHSSRSSSQILIPNLIYSPPTRSCAKKAEWIYAIGTFFSVHGSNNSVYIILNESLPSATVPAAASGHGSSPTMAATTINPMPINVANTPSPHVSCSATAHQSHAVSTTFSTAGMVMANSSQSWQQSNSVANTGNVAASINVNGSNDPDTGLLRPAIQVKREPIFNIASQTLQSDANSRTTTTTTNSSAETNELPRDCREMTMVASLRGMGFTCTREILTALRVVASNREEIYGVGDEGDVNEQVEAAMMWIVTQREEVAEAAILDAARVSSEQYSLDIEQSRNQEMTRELENADVVHLLGRNNTVGIDVKSMYYPCSILLRDKRVNGMFLETIVSTNTSNRGKVEVIRLLNLEKKARKWYGTVLPFAYFEHVLRPRIVSHVGGNSVTMLSDESDILERAMFNLSEQSGMVPKVFLHAQRDASRLGKPIRDVEETHVNDNDDDVELLEEPLSLISGRAYTSSIHHVEVIDLS
jgi:hypothetical protein